MPSAERLLTVPEFAARLGIKDSTARAWLLRRKVAKVKIFRAVRIPESEIERLIKAGFVPARPERP